MIKQVGVLGAGQMGSGIAHVLAQQEIEVLLFDIAEAQLSKALAGIEKNLERQAKKEQLASTAIPAIMGRIRTTMEMNDLADCDMAIEAVTEREPLKLEIFRKLDGIVKQGAILASNTSSIPITRIAAVTGRQDKVIGMHFMNPVPVMKLVEVIRGLATSDETFNATADLVAKLDKEMAVSADYPGFIVNRILIPMINEAAYALFEGIATAEDIDKGMKLGTNQPMGPLTLADFIGLDTCLAIMNVLYEGFKDTNRAEAGLPAPGPDRFGHTAFVYTGDTDEEGVRVGSKLLWFLNTGLRSAPQYGKFLPGAVPAELAPALYATKPRPGVPAAARPAAGLIGITAEQAMAKGLMFAGDPDSVYRQICEYRERVGPFEHLVLASRSGFMTHGEATKGLRLFAKEVLPRLREL